MMKRCFTKKKPLGGACVSHFAGGGDKTLGQKATVCVGTSTIFPDATALEACRLGNATQIGRVRRGNTGGHAQVSTV